MGLTVASMFPGAIAVRLIVVGAAATRLGTPTTESSGRYGVLVRLSYRVRWPLFAFCWRPLRSNGLCAPADRRRAGRITPSEQFHKAARDEQVRPLPHGIRARPGTQYLSSDGTLI